MQDETRSDYAPSLLEKVKMWMIVRKKIKLTQEAIANNKLIMALFQNQREAINQFSEEGKKDRAELQLKVGQLEAKVLADQRALAFFQGMDYSDPELYKPVEL